MRKSGLQGKEDSAKHSWIEDNLLVYVEWFHEVHRNEDKKDLDQ